MIPPTFPTLSAISSVLRRCVSAGASLCGLLSGAAAASAAASAPRGPSAFAASSALASVEVFAEVVFGSGGGGAKKLAYTIQINTETTIANRVRR